MENLNIGLVRSELIFKKHCSIQVTCISTFKALFSVDRLENKPKCVSSDKGINKIWYVYAMQCFPEIKRNEKTWWFVPVISPLRREKSRVAKSPTWVILQLSG